MKLMSVSKQMRLFAVQREWQECDEHSTRPDGRKNGASSPSASASVRVSRTVGRRRLLGLLGLIRV